MNSLQIIISLIALKIIHLIGWQDMPLDVQKRLIKYDRVVLVFSHTSYVDFYIFLLYILAYPKAFANLKFLVKPQPFAYFGYFLRKMGAIKSTKIEERNGQGVERISTELDSMGKFLFMLSPKGTICKREWRSGYYYIANNTKAKMMAGGLDYEKCCVYLSIRYKDWYTKLPAAENFLKQELYNIVPLFPEEEGIPIRDHKYLTVIYNFIKMKDFILSMFTRFVLGTLSLLLLYLHNTDGIYYLILIIAWFYSFL